MEETPALSRDVALAKERSVLLIIDVQNYCCSPRGGMLKGLNPKELEAFEFYVTSLNERVLPNIKMLQKTFRANGMEVMYAVIESLTLDGRDRGLDYKITGFNVPRGSFDAQVAETIAPQGDEIILSKTSSSVFNSTNVDYVLRNLGCRQLVLCGLLTDQCVESAVRDACDMNYLVTLVQDACTTMTQARHDNALAAIKGYCRQVNTCDLVDEIQTQSRG